MFRFLSQPQEGPRPGASERTAPNLDSMAFFKEKRVRGAHSLNETGGREGKERGLVSHVPDSSEGPLPGANALSYFQEAHQVDIPVPRGRLLEVA